MNWVAELELKLNIKYIQKLSMQYQKVELF